MKRHESREQALTFLFESIFNLNTPEEILEFAASSRKEKISNFSRELFLGTLEKVEDIDLIIEKHLKGWKKSRLSKIILSILRLGVFEMIYYKTEHDIVIDQAVKLSQKYATQEDALYVNGVLGSIGRNFCSSKEKDVEIIKEN